MLDNGPIYINFTSIFTQIWLLKTKKRIPRNRLYPHNWGLFCSGDMYEDFKRIYKKIFGPNLKKIGTLNILFLTQKILVFGKINLKKEGFPV